MYPGTSPTIADIASRAVRSVVQVVADDRAGSGVVVDAGIVTSAQLVDQVSRTHIVDREGHTAPATVLRVDRQADLALLQTSLDVPALQTELMAEQRQGDEVLVLGPQRAPADDVTLTRGLISAIGVEPGSGRALIHTDAAQKHGGALVNMRGKLIGIPLVGADEAVAVAMDTVAAFLQAPLHAVAPTPATPIFRGDPRTIALSTADLGGGAAWALVATDTSHISDGLYGEQFVVEPAGDPAITLVVGVLPGVRTAVEQWAPLAAPSDASFVAYPVSPIGDASFGAVSDRKQTLTISARAKNVLLSVEITSASYLSAAGALEELLAQMIGRVNAQAG